MSKDTFESLRPKIDEAVRAGLTLEEFLELHDISRKVWYLLKPKGFHWSQVQVKLGIDRKYRKKLGRPAATTKKESKPNTVQKNNPKPKTTENFYLNRASEVALVISREIIKQGFSQEVKNAMAELKQLNILLEAIENEN